MSTLYRTAYHVDMKTIPAWYEPKRPRTRTSRSHSPTDPTGAVGRRGLVLKSLFTLVQRFISVSRNCFYFPWILGLSSSANFINVLRFIKKFSFHSSAATLLVTKLSHHLLHGPDLIQNNFALENLLLLVLFVISFSISNSCIFIVVFSIDLKSLNLQYRTINSEKRLR